MGINEARNESEDKSFFIISNIFRPNKLISGIHLEQNKKNATVSQFGITRIMFRGNTIYQPRIKAG